MGTFALVAPPAQATEITVPCDPAALVQAVSAANATSEPDTLSLAANCVYTLTAVADATWKAGLPSIQGKLTVDGNHATIERAKDAPRFRIISNWGDLTLNEVTIAGGHAPDGVGTNSYGDANPGGSGGGIENWGPLTITDSVISGNTSGSGAPGADATATTTAGRGGGGGFGGGISSYSSSQITLTITRTSIIGNATGAGGPGGNGVAAKPGGRGGSAGFGAGVDVVSGTVLRITGGSVTGNSAGSGGKGGTGGAEGGGAGDGGSGGVAGGVFMSSSQGVLLNPAFTGTTVTGNQAGRGGDAGVAGPGGYSGYSGYGGRGGGLGVFDDSLTLDQVKVGDNAAGEPGAGSYPSPASGGGIHTLNARVTLVNGAAVSGNLPDNCVSPADVPGCVNDFRTAEVHGPDQRAIAERAAVIRR
ncbi:polymorphic outer membrane protein [Amycolatopsis decaplanina DSM 44594]|uniref:Polymorphic outer membrane protein n=1 Tax=Amycolatopsis decaplanina DSM 44594 TaxID=1284240 RepID=M2Y5N5_9PSEU|nr:polymorphic outer membrane protein [Amycolatopsis decaplanina DSM 44594]